MRPRRHVHVIERLNVTCTPVAEGNVQCIAVVVASDPAPDPVPVTGVAQDAAADVGAGEREVPPAVRTAANSVFEAGAVDPCTVGKIADAVAVIVVGARVGRS